MISSPFGIIFYIYFPAEISEFSFNPRGKIGWPPGHWDKVCMFYDTKTINLITFKIRMLIYSLNIYNVLDFNTLSNWMIIFHNKSFGKQIILMTNYFWWQRVSTETVTWLEWFDKQFRVNSSVEAHATKSKAKNKNILNCFK